MNNNSNDQNDEKTSLVNAAKVIQRKLCAYDMLHWDNPPHTCDCKYGITRDSKEYSEDTGCPEMRDIIKILSFMSGEEFSVILSRIEDYQRESSKSLGSWIIGERNEK